MTIDQQIQQLIKNAPMYGVSPYGIEAIAPILSEYARRLTDQDYFILQSQDERWLLTTLSHRTQPDLQKKVVYAFASQGDALRYLSPFDPNGVAVSIPVTRILFQLLGLESVDSIVFFPAGERTHGQEIFRQELQKHINEHLDRIQQYRSNPLPPDIA